MKLKPCPFCGEKVKLINENVNYPGVKEHPSGKMLAIKCICGFYSRWCFETDIEKFLEVWNTRPEPAWEKRYKNLKGKISWAIANGKILCIGKIGEAIEKELKDD